MKNEIKETNQRLDRLDKTYLANQLVNKLNDLVKKHGDLPVYLNDPDSQYRLEIGIIHRPANFPNEWPERFEIKACYYGRPKGNVDKK